MLLMLLLMLAVYAMLIFAACYADAASLFSCF